MVKNQKFTDYQLISQKRGNIVSDMDGEKVMLSIHNGKYYNLGEMGGEIWDLMEEPISIQTIVATLQERYNVDQIECHQHVTDFLNQLLKEGIIDVKNNPNS